MSGFVAICGLTLIVGLFIAAFGGTLLGWWEGPGWVGDDLDGAGVQRPGRTMTTIRRILGWPVRWLGTKWAEADARLASYYADGRGEDDG